MPIKQLVLASNNPGKIRELSALLAPLAIEVIPQAQFNLPEAAEPHPDVHRKRVGQGAPRMRDSPGLPALAEDSGICVDALDGGPGVLSARFAGEPRSDERNNDHLLQLLVRSNNRAAHYYCVAIVLQHDAIRSH